VGDNGQLDYYSVWNDKNQTGTDINGTSMVVINAIPDNGYIVSSIEWNNSNGLEGVYYSDQIIIPTMDGNYSFTASFKEPPNDLNYNFTNNSPSLGIIEDSSEKASLNQRTFIATPLLNNSFLGWSFSENAYPNPSWVHHQIDINVSEGMEIKGHFQETPSKIKMEYNDDQGIVSSTTTGNQVLNVHEFEASPLTNYIFSHWENSRAFEYQVGRNFSSIVESHSRLFVDELESPQLNLVRGYTYTFHCNLANNDYLFFSHHADDNFSQRITDGIIDTQISDNKLIFTVPLNSPDVIYYNGSNNKFSGNIVRISDMDEEVLIPNPTSRNLTLPNGTDFSIVAHFSPVEFDLSTEKSGEGSLTLSKDTDYRFGDVVNIVATPSQHWKFSHWESNADILTPKFPDINITIAKDTEVVAIFEPKKYFLNLSSTPASFGSANTVNNKYEFSFGEIVKIKANPKSGKRFVTWSGNPVENLTSAETSVTISGDTTLTASFEAQEYDADYSFVVVDKNNQELNEIPGEITGKNRALDEEIVSFSFDLEPGYEFLYWRDGDSNISLSTDPSYSRKIKGYTNTQAVVRKLFYQIRVTSYPSNTGAVFWNNHSYEDFFEFTVYHGETISFSSQAQTGYQFKNWMSSSGNLPFPTSKSINFTANMDLQVAAYFEPISDLELNILIEPADSGWSVGSGIYDLNDAIPILAIAKDGWLFKQWIGNDINQTNSASTTVNLFEDRTIIAQFVEDPDYEPDDGGSTPNPNLNVLLVSPSSESAGTTTGSGFYDDTWVDISASPKSNYLFSHWKGVGVENSLSAITRVFVDKDLEVTAHFEYLSQSDHTLFVTSNNSDYGEVSDGGNYRDVMVDIEAFPNTGYQFIGWEGDGIVDIFSLKTQIFVNATKEAIAYFQPTSIFTDSVEMGNGWWNSPWFGNYWKSTSSKWTYHSILGWIHIRNRSDNSTWIWIDKLNGWFWSGKPHFPYLYHASTDNSSWYWLSLERSSPQQILIYKFGELAGWKSY
jgi:hypothetical protein